LKWEIYIAPLEANQIRGVPDKIKYHD